MKRKLQCILVDDEPWVYDVFKEYLKNNEYAIITDYYQDPIEFLRSNKKPDLVFIDIVLPNIDGFTVAHSIQPIPVILFTGDTKRFGDILNMIEPIDVFSKPIIKERLLSSVKKAYKLLVEERNEVETHAHWEFNTKGKKDKIFVKIKDIVYVTTHDDPRNKLVTMSDGTEHIIMDYSMEEILTIATHLLQPNKSELVSSDIITTHGFDHIMVTIPNIRDEKMIIIGYPFSKIFKEKLHRN